MLTSRFSSSTAWSYHRRICFVGDRPTASPHQDRRHYAWNGWSRVFRPEKNTNYHDQIHPSVLQQKSLYPKLAQDIKDHPAIIGTLLPLEQEMWVNFCGLDSLGLIFGTGRGTGRMTLLLLLNDWLRIRMEKQQLPLDHTSSTIRWVPWRTTSSTLLHRSFTNFSRERCWTGCP